MSHFTTINTQIKDVSALRSAVKEMGFELLSNTDARGFATMKQHGDYVIRLKGPYDIAVNKQQDGTFGLTTDWFNGHVEKEVGPNFGRFILLKDFHLFLTDPNPMVLRKLKDALLIAKTRQTPLIILACRLCLPPELERELTVVEFQLPDKHALELVYHGVVESADIRNVPAEERTKAVGAACGLTTMEAENAFALAVVQTKQITPSVVAREKAQAVKKNGLLEIVEAKESLSSIGGLDCHETMAPATSISFQ